MSKYIENASTSNVTLNPKEAMLLQSSVDENEDQVNNFVFDSHTLIAVEYEIDESKATKIRIEKFEKSLRRKDSFFNTIVWAIYYKLKIVLKQNNFVYDDEKLKEVLGTDFIQKISEIKNDIVLDINMDAFEQKMHLVNDLLFEKQMFLRLYEKKTKFRYLLKKGHDQNEVQKDVLSCIEQRYNGF